MVATSASECPANDWPRSHGEHADHGRRWIGHHGADQHRDPHRGCCYHSPGSIRDSACQATPLSYDRVRLAGDVAGAGGVLVRLARHDHHPAVNVQHVDVLAVELA